MKRKVGFIAFLMLAALCFADKWKATDFFYPARVDKMIENYGLTKTYDEDNIVVYQNEETKDWIFIYTEGNEDDNPKSLYKITYANLGGQFESCTKYGQLVDRSAKIKYLTSVITEANYLVPEQDFQSNSNYVWRDTQSVFINMFYKRLLIYVKLANIKDNLGLTIPEKDINRYSYFIKWWNENTKGNENIAKDLTKEYKTYLKKNK